jgi:hypothetical protein
MSATRRLVKWWMLLPFIAGGCGADANVVIQLVSLSQEDPYAGVASLEVTASVNERELTRQQVDFDGQPIALDALKPRDNMVIRAIGYDNASQVISRGLARPEIPDDGDCCVLMCFCALAVFESGDCSCGSDACVAECFP